jgi:uncharacterized iron-regulated membrane protein
MNLTLRSILRNVHAWMGLILALLLIVITLTGTLLIWKQEYLWLTLPEARTSFEPTPEALANIATSVEAQYEINELYKIDFATADFPISKIYLDDYQYAYVDTHGRVITQWSINERTEDWLFDLHHRLLLDNLGLTVVGCAGIAALLLVFSGLITYWPMRRGFKQGVIPHSAATPQLRRSHRNLGVIISIPLLMSLITGIIQAFPDQSQELLLEPFRGEDYTMDFIEGVDNQSGNGTGDWLPAIERALAIFPNSQIRTASFPNRFSSYRIIGLQQQGELSPLGLSKVYIDSKQGYMDMRIDSQAQHLSERIYQTSYPLHTSNIDSLLYKILLTLSGLMIITLSCMGLYSFINRHF